MPEMDGFEATRILRKIEADRDGERTPIVALTAHIADNIRNQVINSGMDEVVTKPFTIQSLGTSLQAWLGSAWNTDVGQRADVMSEPEVLPTQQSHIIDPGLLANLRDIAGDNFEATLNSLHKLYCENAPASFEALVEACKVKSGKQVQESAHALKSMSNNIGAGVLAAECQAMEDLVVEGDMARLDPGLVRVAAAFRDVLSYLKDQGLFDEVAETGKVAQSSGA